MTKPLNRNAIFISHATPEDNPFALWLGAKLSAMGFEVWADVMKLRGGVDWARALENALRNHSTKLLVVCTPRSMEAQGVRNEIEIGAELSRDLNDSEFTIPLRLSPYKAHIRIAHLQYIDFSKSWANGLVDLTKLLLETQNLVANRTQQRISGDWLISQSDGATHLVQLEERLSSNWLEIQSRPNNLYYCEPPSGFPVEKFQQRDLHTSPIVPIGNGVLTYAEPDQSRKLSPEIPATIREMVPVEDYLENGWARLGVKNHEARRHFSDLGNQAFERFLLSRSLSSTQGANGLLTWWGALGKVPASKIRFNWPDQKGLRQIIGRSTKRNVHWHYGIGGSIRTGPVPHLQIFSRLIFSDNGQDAIRSATKMHQLRRSFSKTWRNARWRDMLCAFLWWLSQGEKKIILPVSQNRALVLGLPPMHFMSPCKRLAQMAYCRPMKMIPM